MPKGVYKRTEFHKRRICEGIILNGGKPVGDKHPSWKGGKPRCIDCGEERGNRSHDRERCRACYLKFNVGENHPNYGIDLRGEKNPNWKGGIKTCDACGKVLSHRLKRTKICRSCYTGERNHAWRGGISRLPYPLGFDKKLKELIRERDNRECRLCGVPESAFDRKLCVHHIDYDKDNLAINNLITLCSSCNASVNTDRFQWQEYFSHKTGELICAG